MNASTEIALTATAFRAGYETPSGGYADALLLVRLENARYFPTVAGLCESQRK